MEEEFLDLTWSPDGKRLILGSNQNNLQLWDAASGKKVTVVGKHDAAVRRVMWLPGDKVVAFSDRGTAKVWQLGSRAAIQSWKAHEKTLRDAILGPKGEWLVSSGADKRIKIWRTSNGSMLKEFCLGSPANSLQFDAKRKWLVAGTQDGRIYLWDTKDWRQVGFLRGSYSSFMGIAFHPKGTSMVAGHRTGQLWHWLMEAP